MNSWVIDSRIRFKRSLLWALLLHAALALLAFLVLGKLFKIPMP